MQVEAGCFFDQRIRIPAAEQLLREAIPLGSERRNTKRRGQAG